MFSNSALGLAFEAALAELAAEEELHNAIKKTNSREAEGRQEEEDEDDVPFALRQQRQQIDDLFVQLDSGSGAFTAAQQQELWNIFSESMLEALRGAAEMKAAPNTHVIIKSPAAVQEKKKNKSNNNIIKKAKEGEEEEEEEEPVLAQFPMYRCIDNSWTLILRNPEILIAGDIVNDEEIVSRSALQNRDGRHNNDDDDDDNSDLAVGHSDAARLIVEQVAQQQRAKTRTALTGAQSNGGAGGSSSAVEHKSRRIKCDYAVLHVKHEPVPKAAAAAATAGSRRKRKE